MLSGTLVVPQSDDEEDDYHDHSPIGTTRSSSSSSNEAFHPPEYVYPESRDMESVDLQASSQEPNETMTNEITTNITPPASLSVSTIRPDIAQSIHTALSTQKEDPLTQFYAAAGSVSQRSDGAQYALDALKASISAHRTALFLGKNPQNARQRVLEDLTNLMTEHKRLRDRTARLADQYGIFSRAFRSWASQKRSINEQIAQVERTAVSSAKLEQLESASNELSSEIEALEAELANLKAKRRVLRREIAQTKNSVNAEKALFVEELNSIESAEQEAARTLINERLVSTTVSRDILGRNVVENLRLAFSMLATVQTNVSQVASEVEVQKKRFAEASARHTRSFEEFEELKEVWNQICQELRKNEQKVVELVAQGYSQDDIRGDIENLLGKSGTLLIQKLRDFRHINHEDEAYVFENAIISELEAVYKTLRVVAPASRIIVEIGAFLLGEPEEPKSRHTNNVGRRIPLLSPVAAEKLGPPPETSYVGAFGKIGTFKKKED